MSIERGVLVIRPGGKGKPPRIQVRVGKTDFNPSQGEISQSILDRLGEFDGKEVEFERVGGQPKKIRESGGSFVQPGRQGQAGMAGDRPLGAFGSRRTVQQQGTEQRDRPQGRRDFHNPYNFVPAPPRNTDNGDLGDHCPVPQDAFLPNRYSGHIRVRMTAKTPLLVPDTDRVQVSASGHKTYPLLVDLYGKPLIPASSVRGMLRSAYEAVTNSRFGRFSQEQHRNRLAFRMEASQSLRLIPARIENGHIFLLTGTSNVGRDGRPNGPMYAAWLPRYDRNGKVSNLAVRYADDLLPQHGDEVACWVEKIQHSNPSFVFWRVRAAVRGSDTYRLGPQLSVSQGGEKSSPTQPTEMKRVHGWVCVTNANIKRKHDERLFFSDVIAGVPGPFPVTEAHRSQWRDLILNYQSIHEDDLKKRRNRSLRPDQYLGPEPGQTAWSRHVYTPGDSELVDGTLCYVRLNASRTDVDALFPVMIARELHSVSPWDLLEASLRPAATIDELSPADRVFGWVKSAAKAVADLNSTTEPAAVRSLLRVGPVTCESSVEEAVQSFSALGVPLAILSTPKPQQGRFYVAGSNAGEAQRDGLSKTEAGYSENKGLRGRKVYPHQASLSDSHWDKPMQDRTQEGSGNPAHYQEYRRPQKNGHEQRDDQNRSILGWVKPGAQFTFELNVHNLSAVELGALLWLLKLPDGHFFRFGGGKPLGLGSVRLTIDDVEVRTGQDLLFRYSAWHTLSAPADPSEMTIQSFKEVLRKAYPPPVGEGFESVSFIAAFLAACRGFDDGLPIHYPRAPEDGEPGPPSPDSESFKWFVANERDRKLALPDLAKDKGLPTLEDRS